MPKRGKKKEESGSGDEDGPRPAKAAKAAKAAPAAPPYEDPPTRETTPEGRRWTLKVTSWNVDGLRAWVRKGGAQAPPLTVASPHPPHLTTCWCVLPSTLIGRWHTRHVTAGGPAPTASGLPNGE
ncbi:hypothetical protein TURU_054485 [Turdus rufiventris]|nr:hypothetical protein TURU_054485 [Turdus rufiventris]